MSSQQLGALLEELEQSFAHIAKGATQQLQLRATQTLTRQHIAPAAQARELLTELLTLMVDDDPDRPIRLHVHCLRTSIAFDFDRFPEVIPGDLLLLAERIGATLAPGGAAMRLEVPRTLATSTDRHSSEHAPIETPALCGLHLLVVDEDSIHRRNLVTSLMRAGLEIHACNHEDAGLEVAMRGDSLAALIVHIHRPLSSGLQVVHRLRDSGIPQPLIALTSHVEAGDKEYCLRNGCAGQLSRSASSQALLQELERIFTTKAATPEGRSAPTENRGTSAP